MDKKDWLEKNFEETRQHLKAVAYRMLGSTGEAEDAVQEAWARLTGSDSEKIENLNGWLTTVVSRVCLDKLRSRKTKGEVPYNDSQLEEESTTNPEAEFMLADSVGSALLVVLETLTPTERIAFVLHDLFDLSFEEIAPIIDRTEEATRQLASRARRRVRGIKEPQADTSRRKEMVTAFLMASREGKFDALIRILHPEAVLRADETAIRVAEANKDRGAPQFKKEIKGASNVANTMKGKAAEACLALVDGEFGMTWAPTGKPIVAFRFTFDCDSIAAIDIVMDPKVLKTLNVKIIDSEKE